MSKLYTDTDFSQMDEIPPETLNDYFGPWMMDPSRDNNFVAMLIFTFPSPRYEVYEDPSYTRIRQNVMEYFDYVID